MPNASCSNCGQQLPYDGDRPPEDRVPCPKCGSTKRNYAISVEPGRLAVSGSIAGLSVTRALITDWVEQRVRTAAVQGAHVASTAQVFPGAVEQEPPDLIVGAGLTIIGGRTTDGALIQAVAAPWFDIIGKLASDPNFLKTIHWRELEEVIAGGFKRDGWPEVVITPRNGDQGRDVIATKPGVCSIRVIAQVKRYTTS